MYTRHGHVEKLFRAVSTSDIQVILIVAAGTIFVLFLYFLPYFIARNRGVANRGWLFVVNFLSDFTGLGWIICMVWAIFGETETMRRYWDQVARDSDAAHSDLAQDGQRTQKGYRRTEPML